jgi:hypothetical protein
MLLNWLHWLLRVQEPGGSCVVTVTVTAFVACAPAALVAVMMYWVVAVGETLQVPATLGVIGQEILGEMVTLVALLLVQLSVVEGTAEVTVVGFALIEAVGVVPAWQPPDPLGTWPVGHIVTFTDTLPSAANPDISSTYAVAVKVAPPATSPAVGV